MPQSQVIHRQPLRFPTQWELRALESDLQAGHVAVSAPDRVLEVRWDPEKLGGESYVTLVGRETEDGPIVKVIHLTPGRTTAAVDAEIAGASASTGTLRIAS